MLGPKEVELDIDQDISDADFEDDSSHTIATDRWGNEWDGSGEFNDMDFRLVDDE